jgi:hypothetical protein
MLSSITPLGERGRGTSWSRTVAAYVAGSTISGGALGALLGSVGRLVPASSWWTALLGTVCIIGLAAERGLLGLHLPTTRRQVDVAWLGIYRGWVYGAGYGLQLGVGIGTIVVSSAIYVMIASEVLAGSASAGLLIGTAFGLARGSTIFLGGRATDQRGLMDLHASLERSRARVIAVSQGVMALAGIAGIAGALR